MMMNSKKRLNIPLIIVKEINGLANPEEKKALSEWLKQSESNRQLFLRLTNNSSLASAAERYDSIDSEEAWKKISAAKNNRFMAVNRRILSLAKYAAVIALPILIGSYFLFYRSPSPKQESLFHQLAEQISEYKESSLLLSDGQRVILGDVQNDSVLKAEGAQISKSETVVIYSDNNTRQSKELKYNTLIAPMAKVYSVLLADGTRVWLNASSALHYPTHFSSGERRVFLTGEAYFEVAKDNARPFIVSTRDMDVVALGTSFNVMSYPDDSYVVTTLVSGAVRVKSSSGELVLHPGKQARLNLSNNTLDSLSVPTEQYTSWISGKYIFDNTNIREVMARVARWYDIKISYDDDSVQELHFTGTLYQYDDLNQILQIIQMASNIKILRTDDDVVITTK